MAVGANYSFELISIETYAPQFIGYNKLFLGSVPRAVGPQEARIFFSQANFKVKFPYLEIIQILPRYQMKIRWTLGGH